MWIKFIFLRDLSLTCTNASINVPWFLYFGCWWRGWTTSESEDQCEKSRCQLNWGLGNFGTFMQKSCIYKRVTPLVHTWDIGKRKNISPNTFFCCHREQTQDLDSPYPPWCTLKLVLRTAWGLDWLVILFNFLSVIGLILSSCPYLRSVLGGDHSCLNNV